MIYQQTVSVRFHEADGAGVLFFARYFELAHKVLEDFVHHLNLYPDWFGLQKWVVPIVHAESDYLRSLIPGQTYDVQLEVKKLGDSSFTMKYRFEQGGTLYAQVLLTHAFVDVHTKKKMTIPENVRTKLAEYLT